MADEKTKLDEISSKRAERQSANSVESSNDGATGDGAKGSTKSPAKKTRRRRAPRKPRYDDILPVETFKEYTDSAIDFIPTAFKLDTKASDTEKAAIAKTGRNVLCKRLDNAENLDEILLAAVLVPLVLRWTFEGLGKLVKKEKPTDEKQTPFDLGKVGNG